VYDVARRRETNATKNKEVAFQLQILGAESLGVRGLCCMITLRHQRILIDPGIALGYLRHGLHPHPFQVAVGAAIRRSILAALRESTDVVLSHFHGDHVPLADANPYQLPLELATAGLRGRRLWAPDPHGLAAPMRARHEAILDTGCTTIQVANGRQQGVLCFSEAMPHGDQDSHLGSVIMTRIDAGDTVFVHASDIQLLEAAAIDQILAWSPTLVLAGGPPLYLAQLSGDARSNAWQNALRLSQGVPTLILDHHLLRSTEGIRWLEALAAESPNRVACAADYMHLPRRMLEAWRPQLYRDLPVPEDWHRKYASGKTDTSAFETWRNIDASRV